MSSLEVRINKEVRDYQEKLFFGLTLRQFLFALLAVAVAVGVYFGLHPVVGNARRGLAVCAGRLSLCHLAAFYRIMA
ncbi:MAG: PrgI family protein [Flavonifractor plautii]